MSAAATMMFFGLLITKMTFIAAQEESTAAEGTTFGLPDLPMLPPGMPSSADVDVFKNDAQIGDIPTKDFKVTPPSTVMPADEVQTITQKDINNDAVNTMTETAPTTQIPTDVNITTVASNFDPAKLLTNDSDVIMLSGTETTTFLSIDLENAMNLSGSETEAQSSDQLLNDTIPQDVNDVPQNITGETPNIQITEALNASESFISDTSLDSIPDGQFLGNDTLSNVSNESFTDVTTPDPVIATDTASSENVPSNDTIRKITNNTGEARGEIADKVDKPYTVVDETNIADLLITRPKVSTSAHPITVDVTNIDQYLTTKQKGSPKESFIDPEITTTYSPPIPPPYKVIDESPKVGESPLNVNQLPIPPRFDGFTDPVGGGQFNTAFQPRAQMFYPDGQISKEEYDFIMEQMRDRNAMFNQAAKINAGSPQDPTYNVNIDPTYNPDVSLGPETPTEPDPTPMDIAYDPDFDIDNPLPPPPDPNAKYTTTTTTAKPDIISNPDGGINLPPPPFIGGGVPPPPPYMNDNSRPQQKTGELPPPPIQTIREQSVPTSSHSTRDNTASNTLDFSRDMADRNVVEPRKNPQVPLENDNMINTLTENRSFRKPKVSTDVRSLYDNDALFVADFNSYLGGNIGLPHTGNLLPGIPWWQNNDVNMKSPTRSTKPLPTKANTPPPMKPAGNLNNGNDLPPIVVDKTGRDNTVSNTLDFGRDISNKNEINLPPIIIEKPKSTKSPPPIFIQNNRNLINNVLNPTQSARRNYPRTRVYFGSENNAPPTIKSVDPYERAFEDKIARWGQVVREELQMLQKGRQSTTQSPSVIPSLSVNGNRVRGPSGIIDSNPMRINSAQSRNPQNNRPDNSMGFVQVRNYWADSNSGRNGLSSEKSMNRPPPIRIGPSGIVGTEGPTFLNSGLAKRQTTRTASLNTLLTLSNAEQRLGSKLTLFELPDSVNGNLFAPDSPMYSIQNEPSVKNQEPKPHTHFGGSETTFKRLPPPLITIPSTTPTSTTQKTTTERTTTPTTTTTTKATTTTKPTTTKDFALDRRFLNPIESRPNEETPFETIDASPDGLLANGYTTTAIMMVPDGQPPPIFLNPGPMSNTAPPATTTIAPTSAVTTGANIISTTLSPIFNAPATRGPPNPLTPPTANPSANVNPTTKLKPPPIAVETTTKVETTTTQYIPLPDPPSKPAINDQPVSPTTPVPTEPFIQLTQEEIIARLQKDSVHKKELPPDICHQCHYVNDVCFMSEASICNRFVECTNSGGIVRAYEKECSLGNFWNPKSLACEKSYVVDCPADPCKDARLQRHPFNGRCRAYWICLNETSELKCCPKSYRYSGIDKICVPDESCSEECDAPVTIVQEPPKECLWKPVPGKLLLFTDGYSTQSCAPGTRFDSVQCTCVKSNILPEGALCKADTVVDFEGDKSVAFKDKSGKMNGIGEENVVLRDGTGLFFGTGKLSFWRYANVELGPLLALKIRFFPYGRSKKSMGLMSNCNGSPIGSTVDIRLNTWTNEITFKLSTNQKLNNKMTLKYKPFVWNEAILIYDGSSLSAASNEQTDQIFVEGSIPQRHPAIQVGGCNYKDGYRGYIDDVYVYNGCIPEELDWVLFAR